MRAWRATSALSSGNCPWKKCSPPGTTVTGSDCGRAQSMTDDSATVSSCSPCTTSVYGCRSGGTGGTSKRDVAVPTSTARAMLRCACSVAMARAAT